MSLFKYNPEPVYTMDRNGVFTDLNPSVGEVLGYSRDDLLGMSFDSVVAPEDLPLVTENFQKALEGVSVAFEFSCIDKKGNRVLFYGTKIPIIVDGQITGVFGVAKDITKEKESMQIIKTLAYTDQLTGLHNRAWFLKNLPDMIEKAVNDKQKLAILELDCDGFKKINDTLGHHFGDIFLQKLTGKIKRILRSTDQMIRIGGDEFIIVAENITEAYVERLSKRILKEVNEPIKINDIEAVVTLSIGISVLSEFNTNVETLIKQADLAMYNAKEKGKNNYQFYSDELNQKMTRRSQLEMALNKAIDNNELSLHYQPQINLQTGELAGLEALLRWNSPEYGIISPTEFIPLAEETGLIVPIGEWVVIESCRQIKKWKNFGKEPVKVSLNVSARQFKDSKFVARVREIIEREKVNPIFLEFEITESVMLNFEEATKQIQGLKEIGVSIAIDDFGAGFSSLKVVSNMLIDTLKIDKSLVDDVIENSRKKSIFHCIVQIGKSSNMKIIVEGIETKEQVILMKQYNIIGQGYYFSKPLPAEQVDLDSRWTI